MLLPGLFHLIKLNHQSLIYLNQNLGIINSSPHTPNLSVRLLFLLLNTSWIQQLNTLLHIQNLSPSQHPLTWPLPQPPKFPPYFCSRCSPRDNSPQSNNWGLSQSVVNEMAHVSSLHNTCQWLAMIRIKFKSKLPTKAMWLGSCNILNLLLSFAQLQSHQLSFCIKQSISNPSSLL